METLDAVSPLLQADAPWFATTHRWGMTNLSERDVADYDVDYWQDYWKRTRLQGLVGNGVASFSTYPSKHPLVPTSAFAPQRDLLGEIAVAAREIDLRLCVRMDSLVVPEPMLEGHSEWRAVTAEGELLQRMCINSPYRHEVVFELYAEIIERYGVNGFTDNGGIGVGTLCHCGYCKDRWAREIGGRLPTIASMEDPDYRSWVRWNDDNVMSNWDDTDVYLRKIGGEDTLFLGLVRKFSPLNRKLATRARQVMMDCQSRNDSGTFREHIDEGQYMKGMLQWTKNIAVCSSMTHHSHGYFRFTTDPAVEATTYLLSAIAGGLDPWWHHPIGYSPDRRSYTIAEPLFSWHEQNERYLTNRRPLVTAGLIRSDDNDQFFGRDIGAILQPEEMGEVTQASYRGASHSLFDARVPYRPINIDDIAGLEEEERPAVLVLPNIGGMSDADSSAIREYVREGGSLIATGMTSLFDDDGEPRGDFALSDVFGVHLTGSAPDRRALIDADTDHRLVLDIAALNDSGLGAVHASSRVSPYGGGIVPISVEASRSVLATVDGQPAVVIGEFGLGRVAFVPLDLDRRYYRSPQPAHAELWDKLVSWAARSEYPVRVDSPGFIGSNLYAQGDTRILHLLNYTDVDDTNKMIDRTVPVGPNVLTFTGLPDGISGMRSLTRDKSWDLDVVDGRCRIDIGTLTNHEVLVLE